MIDSEGIVASVFHVCDQGTHGSITYTITLSTGHVWNDKYRGGSKQFDVAALGKNDRWTAGPVDDYQASASLCDNTR